MIVFINILQLIYKYNENCIYTYVHLIQIFFYVILKFKKVDLKIEKFCTYDKTCSK